jgi:biotin carboxyl carrier protein
MSIVGVSGLGVSVEDTLFENNVASTAASRIIASFGGAIMYAENSVVGCKNCTFLKNVAWNGFELHIAMPEANFVFGEASPFPQADAALDAALARAPVAGRVSRVQVAVGDVVLAGQPMVCVEAMKMDMWLTAQAPGRVRALHTALGEQVVLAAVVVELDLDDTQGHGIDL